MIQCLSMIQYLTIQCLKTNEYLINYNPISDNDYKSLIMIQCLMVKNLIMMQYLTMIQCLMVMKCLTIAQNRTKFNI